MNHNKTRAQRTVRLLTRVTMCLSALCLYLTGCHAGAVRPSFPIDARSQQYAAYLMEDLLYARIPSVDRSHLSNSQLIAIVMQFDPMLTSLHCGLRLKTSGEAKPEDVPASLRAKMGDVYSAYRFSLDDANRITETFFGMDIAAPASPTEYYANGYFYVLRSFESDAKFRLVPTHVTPEGHGLYTITFSQRGEPTEVYASTFRIVPDGKSSKIIVDNYSRRRVTRYTRRASSQASQPSIPTNRALEEKLSCITELPRFSSRRPLSQDQLWTWVSRLAEWGKVPKQYYGTGTPPPHYDAYLTRSATQLFVRDLLGRDLLIWRPTLVDYNEIAWNWNTHSTMHYPPYVHIVKRDIKRNSLRISFTVLGQTYVEGVSVDKTIGTGTATLEVHNGRWRVASWEPHFRAR